MAEPPLQGRAYIVDKSHQFLRQSQPDPKDNDDKDKDDKDKDEGKNLEEEEITVADISCFDLVSITKNQSIDLTILTLPGWCTTWLTALQ